MVVACFVLLITEPCSSHEASPILFIPGITGSRLEVKDDRVTECYTFGDYFQLWVNPLRLVLLNQCARDEMKLLYDPSTGLYLDNDQVTIKAPGFGDTDGVEFLGTGSKFNYIAYANDMVEYFVDRGYERGKSIRSAPYDWRLAADQLQKRGYYDQLKKLVEEMYVQNGNRKVTIVVHSMGGPVSLHFLTGYSGIDQNWKDTYINAWVTLSGAWSGGVSAITAVVSGPDKGPNLMLFADQISNFLVPISRTFQSLPWLFPRSSVYGATTIVSTPSKDYTADDYDQLLGNIGYTNGFQTYQDLQSINEDFPAPNVPTFCYYGVNVDTPEKLRYKTDFNGQDTIGLTPEITNGEGDGTVNLVSSQVCHRWSTMPARYPFNFRQFSGVDHQGMITNTRVLADIASVVGAPPPSSKMSM